AGAGAGPAAAAAGAPYSPRFEEVAGKAGLGFRMNFLRPEQGENFKINLYDHGCGLAVADVDGDGLDDVYLLNQLGSNGMFRNRGDGTFEDVTAATGTGLESVICVAAAFGDVDGDRDPDLYVTTVRGGNFLLLNDGKGIFRDGTRAAGLTLVVESMSPCFFDADGDGDLDLLVTNTARWTLQDFDEGLSYFRGKANLAQLLESEHHRDVFYRNDGKGVFTDATEEAGLAGKGWGGDAAILDLEDDGDLDVFVCNMFGASSLYANDGKGRFTEVTREVLGRTSWGAMGARVLDHDGDGLLDLLVADMHSDMWAPYQFDGVGIEEGARYPTVLARAVELGLATPEEDRAFTREAGIREEEVIFGSTLYRNLGGGRFEECAQRAGFETYWPWGIVEGDYDGDGSLDVFIPSGMRNRGNGVFDDVCGPAGLFPPPGGTHSETAFRGKRAARSSRSGATLDFDGDGRLDIVVNNFNDRAWLWRNVSPERPWCRVRLVETRGRRDAIGAVVRLTAGGRTQTRLVQSAGGYLAQSSSTLHFGLGGATAVEKVEVRWPGGNLQTVTDVKAGVVNTITEPPE
ncbi:MAG: CRTAC1 family protein, partial [Planctomycetaceae bacterium]|nr:CRTAC1 family protein [Planctomycetaceae bacterium]